MSPPHLLERIGEWLSGGRVHTHFDDIDMDDRVEAVISRIDGLESRVKDLERTERRRQIAPPN